MIRTYECGTNRPATTTEVKESIKEGFRPPQQITIIDKKQTGVQSPIQSALENSLKRQKD